MYIQTEIGIPLVIFKKNIILGHIALDKRTFQHQSFKLRASHDDIKIIHLAHHQPGFGRMGSRILEILADTVFQFLRLAHIDNRILCIPHQIHAGQQGKRSRFIL